MYVLSDALSSDEFGAKGHGKCRHILLMEQEMYKISLDMLAEFGV